MKVLKNAMSCGCDIINKVLHINVLVFNTLLGRVVIITCLNWIMTVMIIEVDIGKLSTLIKIVSIILQSVTWVAHFDIDYGFNQTKSHLNR